MFRKTKQGRVGILTIPQGARLYCRKNGGRTFERARKEFDVLAMTTTSTPGAGVDAYSFKLGNDYWYVLMEDIEPNTEDGGNG